MQKNNRHLSLTFTLTFWTENWHTGYSFPGESSQWFWFFAPFCFRLRIPYTTDRWTERQTRKTRTAAC